MTNTLEPTFERQRREDINTNPHVRNALNATINEEAQDAINGSTFHRPTSTLEKVKEFVREKFAYIKDTLNYENVKKIARGLAKYLKEKVIAAFSVDSPEFRTPGSVRNSQEQQVEELRHGRFFNSQTRSVL